jgi:hypothetical protein
MKKLNLIEQRFGRLVVVEKLEETNSGHIRWLCKCDCGKEKAINGTSLTKGVTNSCGCLAKELLAKRSHRLVRDLVGLKFGKLTVVSRNEEYQNSIKSKSAYWNCKCECDSDKIACGSNLTKGTVRSCGCLRKEVAIAKFKNRSLPVGEAGFNEIYSHYKGNAAKKERIFCLDKEVFRRLLIGNCYYCGSPPSNLQKNNTGNFIYSGIDRMDNDKGYELSNCVSCCYICNKAKMNMNSDIFLKHVERIHQHQKIQEIA